MMITHVLDRINHDHSTVFATFEFTTAALASPD
jgi:hypothetical protein